MCNSDVMCVNSALVYDQDCDFGDVAVVEPNDLSTFSHKNELLPSEKNDREKLFHLTETQKKELLDVLDKFPECFSTTPGFCGKIPHKIVVNNDFVPKRLKAYKIPERLKPEVHRQIQELLNLGFIQEDETPMASPVVCVLKGKDGKNGVRIAIDYSYVNKFTRADALPLPNPSDILQRIGNAKLISTFDSTSGYHQTEVHPDSRWLTGFICDDKLYTWVRTPFGLRNSGATFVRNVQILLRPIRDFTGSYVDDLAVYSNDWSLHLGHITKFLQAVSDAGMTLNLRKCKFAKPELPFVGQIIGSGKRRADPDKLSAVHSMATPETKKQLRQLLGFFSYFREFIPNYAALVKPLTDLTAKRVPNMLTNCWKE